MTDSLAFGLTITVCGIAWIELVEFWRRRGQRWRDRLLARLKTGSWKAL